MTSGKRKKCLFERRGGFPCNLKYSDQQQMCEHCRPYWTGPVKPPKGGTPADRGLVIQLLQHLGIPWTDSGRAHTSFDSWDGDKMDVSSTLDDLCHEIAHWLVAAKKRRAFDNFGLNPYDKNCPERIRLQSTAQREEELASLLGILIMREFRFDWRGCFRHHSWDTWGSLKRMKVRLRELKRRGFIQRRLKPTCLYGLKLSSVTQVH